MITYKSVYAFDTTTMYSEENFNVRNLSVKNDPHQRKILIDFLEKCGLDFEEDIDFTVALFLDNEIIATASISGSVIKCVAVDPKYRGENITSKLITSLKLNAYYNGTNSLFLFTSPNNLSSFKSLGFTEIAVTEKIVLMEDNIRGFRDYLESLKKYKNPNCKNASIVMNCNPFTLGHRYLIEQASKENEDLLIFVVEEDKSIFPFKERFKLVQEGTADLKNVKVIPAGKYIISQATFPSYFIKDKEHINDLHTTLDLTIFSNSIAPAAGISKRYVGKEPFCPVTERYNTIMKEILPKNGIEVIELERVKAGNKEISASEVRRRIGMGKIEAIRELVPESTYKFFRSAESESIIKKLVEMNNENS